MTTPSITPSICWKNSIRIRFSVGRSGTTPWETGPSYVRQVPRTMMEFEANPATYRGKPKIDRVVLKFIALGASEVTELLSGNVQAAESLPFGTLKDDPRFETYYELGYGLRGIAWNHRHPLFREPGVRQALTLAINRSELHRMFLLPAEIPILDVVPTNGQLRRGDIPDPLPYDPDRAKRLLDAAGWRDVDQHGVRVRNGTPFHFVVLTNETDDRAKAAVYVQAQLRNVGVRMDIQTMDWSGVRAHVTAGTFEAAMIHVDRGFTIPIGLLWLFGPDSAPRIRQSEGRRPVERRPEHTGPRRGRPDSPRGDADVPGGPAGDLPVSELRNHGGLATCARAQQPLPCRPRPVHGGPVGSRNDPSTRVRSLSRPFDLRACRVGSLRAGWNGETTKSPRSRYCDLQWLHAARPGGSASTVTRG